jgi:hypothetical protein
MTHGGHPSPRVGRGTLGQGRHAAVFGQIAFSPATNVKLAHYHSPRTRGRRWCSVQRPHFVEEITSEIGLLKTDGLGKH